MNNLFHFINRTEYLFSELARKHIGWSEFESILISRATERVILTVNVEILKQLYKKSEFLDKSDACTIDSAFLNLCMTIFYNKKFERLTGRDIVFGMDKKYQRKIIIFGASDASRNKAALRYLKAGIDALGFDEPKDANVSNKEIIFTRSICFFAYNYPKSEVKIDEFLAFNKKNLDVLMLGVGGAIDFIKGLLVLSHFHYYYFWLAAKLEYII
jgi:UDP-N-acetyl-D-mannosaminuronic acid transferase (WecB/TagA/CpsF family)